MPPVHPAQTSRQTDNPVFGDLPVFGLYFLPLPSVNLLHCRRLYQKLRYNRLFRFSSPAHQLLSAKLSSPRLPLPAKLHLLPIFPVQLLVFPASRASSLLYTLLHSLFLPEQWLHLTLFYLLYPEH